MSNSLMEPISAKVRPDEKKLFIETCESIGTSPSNAIRMFISAFNKRGGFPFDPSNPQGLSSETMSAIDDAAAGRTSGPYRTVAEMMAALDKD